MADQHFSPLQLDVRHPDFLRHYCSWAFQCRTDMMEAVIATRKSIATTKALMAEADRILARRYAASVGGLALIVSVTSLGLALSLLKQ
jgi:hypothetical protein